MTLGMDILYQGNTLHSDMRMSKWRDGDRWSREQTVKSSWSPASPVRVTGASSVEPKSLFRVYDLSNMYTRVYACMYT